MNKNTGKQRSNKTKERIIEISASLFADSGYDSVSMREIAKKVGIRESSIYNHFKSKGQIRQSLFDYFIRISFESRPQISEVKKMMQIMQPEEIFKNIVFSVGKTINRTVTDIAMFIHFEKFRNGNAAEIYWKYMVEKPVAYYEEIINEMISNKMIKSIDSRLFAEQYNSCSITLTQEFFMTRNDQVKQRKVVESMIKTLSFFCSMMKL